MTPKYEYLRPKIVLHRKVRLRIKKDILRYIFVLESHVYKKSDCYKITYYEYKKYENMKVVYFALICNQLVCKRDFPARNIQYFAHAGLIH